MCHPKRNDPVDDAPEHVEFGRAPEVGDEVEAGAAHTGVVQRGDVGVGERLVDHGHAGVAAVAAYEGVDHGGVVGAVTARLHEHSARQSETILQHLEVVDAGIGRCVRAIRGIRELVARPEDVAMGVTGRGRGCEGGGRVRRRVRRRDGGLGQRAQLLGKT